MQRKVTKKKMLTKSDEDEDEAEMSFLHLLLQLKEMMRRKWTEMLNQEAKSLDRIEGYLDGSVVSRETRIQ